MVTRDIPLNQGCLAPITVNIPGQCLLNPSPQAAVVGGNVLTSQRVTDVVLKAFRAAAASQVRMTLTLSGRAKRRFCLACWCGGMVACWHVGMLMWWCVGVLACLLRHLKFTCHEVLWSAAHRLPDHMEQ